MRPIPSDCLKIIDKIEQANGEVFLIGGCVRDMLLGKEPKDWDIVTSLKPDQLLKIFPKAKTIGKSFGVIKEGDYEIATYRADRYRGKDLSVEFIDSLEEDLARRDFTVNAIALEPKTGNIIDPFNGQQDLKDRVIRFVGDPEERIEEDPCRMLRAYRFVATILGTIDEESEVAIKEKRLQIQWVAKERIRIELLKMMQANYPTMIFFDLTQTELLQYILFPLHDCLDVEQNKYHSHDVFRHIILATEAMPTDNPLLRLAVLLHDIGKPVTKKKIDGEWHFYDHEHVGAIMARELLMGLKFSTKEIEYVCGLIDNHMHDLSLDMKSSTIRRYINRLPVPIEDLIRLRMADKKGNRAKNVDSSWEQAMLNRVGEVKAKDSAFSLKDLAINGHDLIAMGFKPSPLMGQVLQDCMDKVLEEPEKNEKDWLLEYVRTSTYYNKA